VYLWAQTRRSKRALAALTAFVGLWLSACGPFLHTHTLADDLNALHGLWQSAHSPQSPDTSLAAGHVQHPDRCLACEFQANSVSPALTVFAVAPAPRGVPETIALHRSLPFTRCLETPSRAPPAA
jgi:hypothetical protein